MARTVSLVLSSHRFGIYLFQAASYGISLFKNQKEETFSWIDYFPEPSLCICASSRFCAAALASGSVIVWSLAGRRFVDSYFIQNVDSNFLMQDYANLEPRAPCRLSGCLEPLSHGAHYRRPTIYLVREHYPDASVSAIRLTSNGIGTSKHCLPFTLLYQYTLFSLRLLLHPQILTAPHHQLSHLLFCGRMAPLSFTSALGLHIAMMLTYKAGSPSARLSGSGALPHGRPEFDPRPMLRLMGLETESLRRLSQRYLNKLPIRTGCRQALRNRLGV